LNFFSLDVTAEVLRANVD